MSDSVYPELRQISEGLKGLVERIRHLEAILRRSPGRELVYLVPGALSAGSGTIKIYNELNAALTITKVKIAVGTPPAGGDLIVDIHLDGVTIFTDQANRPVILDGTDEGETILIDVPVYGVDQYVTIDIDQVAPGGGEDLSVHVVCK